MKIQRVENLSQAQRERLAYIDFRLYFFGEIGRPDLTSRFGVAPAGATRDLALYREIAQQNIEFDGSSKVSQPRSLAVAKSDVSNLASRTSVVATVFMAYSNKSSRLACKASSMLRDDTSSMTAFLN